MTEPQQSPGGPYGPSEPGSYFSARGSFGSRPGSVSWDGWWSASSPDLLSLFLGYLMLQGWGDGVETRMDCPPGIMGFGAASAAAARDALGDQVVIDYEFEDAPEGAVGAPPV